MSHRMAPGWRIASLAAIVALLGSGVAGLALADKPAGSSLTKRLSPGGRPVRLRAPPPAAAAGLRLLRQAAAACQDISYRGSQVVLWRGLGGSSASVVDVWHEAAGDQGPDGILGMSARLLALLQSNYQVVYAGRGPADRRSALVVEVRRPDGGLAARFWLDARTKLPLRRQIFDPGAHMVSDDAFTRLALGDPGPGRMPAAAPWPVQLDQARLAVLRAEGWQLPDQLPRNLSLFAATEMPAQSRQVIDLSYSDGLAVVSLFVQRGVLGRPMPGWQPVTLLGRTVYSVDTQQQSFAWSAGGFVYVLVADAPPGTISQVVATLPGTTGPGFWQRMSRGLHRLVSWLNPLR